MSTNKDYQRKYYKQNKEKRQEYFREYYKNHKDEIKRRNNERYAESDRVKEAKTLAYKEYVLS